jgi:hypothetical protein
MCVPARDANNWTCIANEFCERTDFPNCIGAVDGKHVRVTQPNESRYEIFNYDDFFMVPMAVADADFCFISI